MAEKIELVVWTNGNAIRKYQGQDNQKTHSAMSGKWFKAIATITPVKEDK